MTMESGSLRGVRLRRSRKRRRLSEVIAGRQVQNQGEKKPLFEVTGSENIPDVDEV